MIRNLSIEEIYEHYRQLVRRYAPLEGRILKTDAYNEAVGGYKHLECWPDGNAVTYLELDPNIVAKANLCYPTRDFRLGDIRHIPFPDNYFAAIFDLSTIDHIPQTDVPMAIEEYARTLCPGGYLVMVVWCSKEKEVEPAEWDGPQYFHQHRELMDTIHKPFAFATYEAFHQSGQHFLVEVVACKQGNTDATIAT